MSDRRNLLLENLRMKSVLERIAMPERPDGTYNLSREACEQLAKETLKEMEDGDGL